MLSIVFLLFSGTNCYLIKQGSYILYYNNKSVSTKKIVEDSATDPKTRSFLNLVNEIRQYAVDSVGLKRNNNYTRYVKIDRKYLIDVVTACDAVSFEKYQWCFPFFGCVPYKGFFEKKDAENEAEKLSSKGFDINIDEVDAFSTLGIFSDPLYSFMSSYSAFGLASLIIHEQTHSTIFIKNQIAFNEQTATFVGNQGAINFIKQKYGEDSEPFKNILISQIDHNAYLNSLRTLFKDLKCVYDSGSLSKEEKINEKEKIIKSYKENVNVNYNALFKTQRYRGIEKTKINNAFLTARMTYTLNLEQFSQLYAVKDSNLKETVNFLKSIKKTKNKNPEKMLESEINK
jgi:predicted aminopeptidase